MLLSRLGRPGTGSPVIFRVVAALLACLALGASGVARAGDAPEAEIQLSGMTFVGSRSGREEVVLESKRVTLVPGGDLAHLERVHARMRERDDTGLFELRCQRGRLELDTIDFHAEGDVVATTSDGRRLYTDWIEYSNEQGLVSTEAPVRIEDGVRTMRGRGFRYWLREGRLVLASEARVEGPLQ